MVVGAKMLSLAIACVVRSVAASVLGAMELYPPVQYRVEAFVDNFDMTNNATFKQRYFQFDRWWQQGNPILLYLGNEGPIEDFYDATGAMFEHAEAFLALVVFVEHRFYGQSMPCRTSSCSLSELRTLTVEQAMADYAWFVQGLKSHLGCPVGSCPVITFGGSYGGMLVAWFRQKYPQLTAGGIAASAPIDFYQGDGKQAAFWEATMHTFRTYGSRTCPQRMQRSLNVLQEMGATAAGRSALDQAFDSCLPLSNETTAADKVDLFIRGVLASLAMLDYTEASQFVRKLPANPVSVACNMLEETSSLVVGLRKVVDLYLNATGDFRCYDFLPEMVGRPTAGDLLGPAERPGMGPWQYQACNELPLQALTTDGFGFYPPGDNQLQEVAATCFLRYEVRPRIRWLPLSLGSSDLRVGELLFTDGEKDPWRAGAIDMSVVHPGLDITRHVIDGAAHHEDLRFDSKPLRPNVAAAKELARASIERWILAATSHSVVI